METYLHHNATNMFYTVALNARVWLSHVKGEIFPTVILMVKRDYDNLNIACILFG